ncbi:MAG TPA: ABC transporter ATP-binding protein [Candidatus Nitrosotenuis sp.]|jgi:putative ABC transport system ATP-binding protein|nr:ABC transporter ATP-binding protein [Candidatus Nitrosotenuis sp.]
MTDQAVYCRQITKSYKTAEVETIALRGVNLEVYKGEFFMLAGPSGCGKTTLISIMAGILHADGGQCIVEGHDFGTMPEEDLLNFRSEHIGFVFQSFNLIPTLTVIENVAVPLIIKGMNRRRALAKARMILHEVGLDRRINSMPNQLSGGQQQRVAIARALVHHPTLIICDEPTSALDHTTGMKILELMQGINEKFQTTFIIVTHDTRIYEFADRIALMDDGRIEGFMNHETH